MSRVLIVDGNADSRLLVADLLEAHGFEVAAVATGREATESLERFEPQLVVLDPYLGEMQGFSTLAALRERRADLPVVAVSGHVLPDDERRIRAAGFDDALGKPYDLDQMVAVVRRLLGEIRR